MKNIIQNNENKANSIPSLGVRGCFSRFRPYRIDAATRDKYADIRVSVQDFIYPYFIVEGENEEQPINTLKGISRFSIDRLLLTI